MRQILLTGIISSSCLMVFLGFQNCTKQTHVKAPHAISTASR